MTSDSRRHLLLLFLIFAVTTAASHVTPRGDDIGLAIHFRLKMWKIMLAIAVGLGSSPIQMALEDDESLLKHAADLKAWKSCGRLVVFGDGGVRIFGGFGGSMIWLVEVGPFRGGGSLLLTGGVGGCGWVVVGQPMVEWSGRSPG
ncbi:hypothetical protein RHMOL_Rhmol03G0286200 [Rhododendron molle]|uniref:Uncharacterized protein n=1 Tax=Rhododendron molle TaxID=49168 RepID=A0ACC0PL51_RHOML|nr:hypothetical protein RHMOL_Rhmol03G0286200 [Rhododendron molle]